MKFEQLYNLYTEAKIRNWSTMVHLKDVPMFSIFMEKELWNDKGHQNWWYDVENIMVSAFQDARKHLSKMGFPSMHANVLFIDYKDADGDKSFTLASAVGDPELKDKAVDKRKTASFIQMNIRLMYGIHHDKNKYYGPLVRAIVHEWAHYWMFKNGKQFYAAVQKFYDNLYHSQIDTIIKVPDKFKRELDTIRDSIATMADYIFQRPFSEQLVDKSKEYMQLRFSKFCERWEITGLRSFIDYSSTTIKNSIKRIAIENSEVSKKATDLLKIYDSLNVQKTIEENYKTDLLGQKVKSGELDNELYKKARWSRKYGMKNKHELWATGVDAFFELPMDHRKRILQLMAGSYGTDRNLPLKN